MAGLLKQFKITGKNKGFKQRAGIEKMLKVLMSRKI
jgi:hypothetical protein